MNAHLMARRAYALSNSSTRTERAIEYDLIARVTHRIKAAAEAGPTSYPILVAALHDNRQLWTALAIDVADGDNQTASGPTRAGSFISLNLCSSTLARFWHGRRGSHRLLRSIALCSLASIRNRPARKRKPFTHHKGRLRIRAMGLRFNERACPQTRAA